MNTLSSVQRVLRALAYQTTDRVPVIPEIIQHALNVSGVTHQRFSTDGAAMAQTVIEAQKKYDYDAVYVSSDNFILAEAFGGEIVFTDEEAPPQLLRHPMNGNLDASLPAFDLKNGRMQVILEATALCRKHYGDDHIFIKTNIDSAPFSAAASLLGPQEWLMALYDDEERADRLLERCLDAIVTYGIAAAQAGAHGIAFGDSVAGLINREQYQRFALPYAQRAIRQLHESTKLPVFYHVCGNTTHLYDLMVQTGADCLEVDSSAVMAELRPYAIGKCALEGNISTVEALYNGTPADVRREADALLSLFGNDGGFILSSACEIPRNSPSENVMEITLAAKEYPYRERACSR